MADRMLAILEAAAVVMLEAAAEVRVRWAVITAESRSTSLDQRTHHRVERISDRKHSSPGS